MLCLVKLVREPPVLYDITYMCNLKEIQMNVRLNRNRLTDYKSEFTVPEGERGKLGLWDRQIRTITK